MEKERNDLIFHNNAIQRFTDILYDKIFTKENIVSKHKAITIKGEKYYGYFLEKGKVSYFMLSEHLDKMPFKINDSTQTDFKGEVFDFILSVTTINIPAKKCMSFKDLVDTMPSFEHTNPLHFTLYKIVAMVSYIDRINSRISTEAGFGKDSVVGIIQQLVDSTVNIYGATFAKLEFSLINKLIILNEMGNLKPEEKMQMQEFLLATGAYFNTYTKRTRRTSDTQEQYNISKLSLMVFYNLPEYYISKAQEYFDQLFTKAVVDRFIPFVFEGRLTTKFEQLFDVEKVVSENEQVYKDCIATLNYFRQNNLTEIEFSVPKEIEFIDNKNKPLKRYERTFFVILKYLSNYSRTQEEFTMLALELYNCYLSYAKLLIREKEIM